jgi:ribosomal protein L4
VHRPFRDSPICVGGGRAFPYVVIKPLGHDLDEAMSFALSVPN